MKSTTSNSVKKILVLGSTGKTGSRVLQRLNNLGVPVQSGARQATPKFDWEDSTTWEQALQNISAVYISFYPDLAAPGATKSIQLFTEAAVKHGVQKLVLLSGRGEEEAQACEKIVMDSGLDWTVVRASWFCQNFSEGNFAEPITAGYVALPAGSIAEPFIDVDDIADVAVAALTEDGHSRKVYEVTGPRLLTFKEAIAEIAKATGKDIRYQKIPMKDYASELTSYGLPADLILLITYLFTEVLDGRNEKIMDGVQQALGRKATDFSEFVRKAVAAGAWN